MESVGFLQWNCQGIRGKKDELLELISNHKPGIVPLQETKLWIGSKFEIASYNTQIRDGHFNRTPHGGVSFLIPGCTPYQVVLLTTDIQAIAFGINIGQLITVCNVYISGTHNFNYNIMNDLIEQLPCPFILLGDLNSHSTMWGCRNTDNRGRILEQILTDKNQCILNSGASTRIC